jgi:hypothetical protein
VPSYLGWHTTLGIDANSSIVGVMPFKGSDPWAALFYLVMVLP